MDAIALTMLAACLVLLGALHPTTPTTTTTLVSAMATGNQDPERFYHVTNMSQPVSALAEDRIAMDTYTYAYLNYSYTMNGQKFEMSFSEEKARYGEGKVLNVRGRLVHIMDDGGDDGSDYACSMNVLGTHHEPLPPAGVTWIALVRRGRCTFEEKVRNVHAKGAAAVIIYNDKPVMNLEKMQIKGKSRNITAVLTYQEVGQNIVQIMSRGVDITAAVIEGRSGMRPINTLNKTSVLFVSISFIVLMIISLVWLIFYYVQRFRYLQTKDQQSRHLCSVTKKAIMKIPTKTGKISDEKDADSDCCAICIEAYKSSDCIRVLPCNHEFHKNCIDPWLIEHRTCPMCKLDVLKFYGFVVGDQIISTPSRLPYPPNIPAHDNDLDDVQVVPVIVVPMPMGLMGPGPRPLSSAQSTSPLPPTLAASSSSSSSSSSSASSSSSSSSSSMSASSSPPAPPPPPPSPPPPLHQSLEAGTNGANMLPRSSSRNSRSHNSSSHNGSSHNSCGGGAGGAHCCGGGRTTTPPTRRNSAPELVTASRLVTDV